MKSILNKTRRPLAIRLARGRVLHLGPNKVGQIATGDAERESVRQLLEAGDLEIVGEGSGAAAGRRANAVGHADSRGHHGPSSVGHRGDR